MRRTERLKSVLIASSVVSMALVGPATPARAQSQPAHPAGHEGMKSGQRMMMPKDDAGYVHMMQMHHQQGIDMAKVAEEKSQRDEVKAFAKKMIEAQQNDIEELRRIERTVKAGSAAHDDHDSMMKGEAQKMMAELRQTQGAAFDQKFIDMMIPHHQRAIDMSTPPTKFKSADVKAFARRTIDVQGKEVKELHQMSKKR